ncbi:hypothetical protein DQ04_02571060 [Trypanosoma grayi]|uniref:hypothetical protein n=1 Tax=Trypanosoma grayi TaxID=71804 RepID=UPI0004F4BB62|nr:hypothetical protein DQ04_02571060 [Trypanosoma grayi]KEG11488.1 hypothetical protein DQ04_02571060 [Trypanosoma grayi]
MHRQTRRFTTVADASDVSQMDPWKDDRCRDFVALNTIQRLRSYHADSLLPVEPINCVRAKNLLLLPKAEPDATACDTTEGCAVDMARILFFGPTSFVSQTSPGRMTASPHGGGYSGRRSSYIPSEEATKTGSIKAMAEVALVAADTQQQNGAHQSGMQNGASENETVPGDIGYNQQEHPNDAFEAGATPLKRPEEENAVTPAPRPPERMDQLIIASEECMEGDKGETNENADTVEVIRFSCAIVDAIVAYYQSLLSRGVVLDRFNAKDLAFSWWVVGRNMDVAALNHHTGPTRRDALLILVRHFYYELLTEQRPKKGLPSSDSSAGSLRKSKECDDHLTQQEEKTTYNEEAKQNQQHSEAAGTGDEARKRPRSRLDPTRTSPPPASSRLRRKVRTDDDTGHAGKVEEKQNAKAAEAPATPPMSSTRVKLPVKQSSKAKGSHAAEGPPAAQSTAEVTATVTTPNKNQAPACSDGDVDGNAKEISEAPIVEKPHRSVRTVNIEEVWRPIRSTRRRLPPSKDSSDFIEANTTLMEKREESTSFLNAVVQRIQGRMTNDPTYAALLTAFSANRPVVKKETETSSGSVEEHDCGGTTVCGMHPALVQLYRYHHVDAPSATVLPLGIVQETSEEGNKEGGQQVQSIDPALHSSLQGGTLLSSSFTEAAAAAVVAVKTEETDDEMPTAASLLTLQIGSKNEEVDTTTPVLRLPCRFSDLTYAQQCLLTWEASLLLDPRPPVATGKRQLASNGTKGDVNVVESRGRRCYDYWRSL